MKMSKLIITVMVLAALGGCTMISDEEWGKLNQDIADLKRDSQDAGKANEALRSQLDEARAAVDGLKKQMEDMEKRVATENALTGLEKDLRKRQADTVADIMSIRSDFQVLTGRFEETRYAMQKSLKEGKISQEEFDLRNKETVQRIDDLQKRVASLEQALVVIKQEKDQAKTSDVPAMEEAYKDAYETFQKKAFKAAREKFEKYLDAYPDSKYSENAQYWIGESYYGEKNFERAIVVFDDVLKKYPDGAKVPAALLKQGMAFSALGDSKSAKAIFKKLITAYPKSEQADTARKKFKE